MKVPAPVKTKRGDYRIQMRLNGVSVVVHGATAKECTREAQDMKAGYQTGRVSVSSARQATVGELCRKYISSRRSSPSTLRSYNAYLRSRFLTLQSTRYCDISDWQSYIDAEIPSCSPKYLKNVWCLIASALRLSGLPVPKVELPQIPQHPHEWLQPDEILVFVKALSGMDIEIFALLALHGMRSSEIYATDTSLIDVSHGRICVRGSVVRGEHNVLVKKDTNKNATSTRDVPIMIPELLTAFSLRDPKAPLFPYKEASMRRHINSLCESLGLPQVGIHGLRHSFASLCYHLNVPEAMCQAWGGWSDIATMRKIYTHLAAADLRSHASTVSGFFASSPAPSPSSLPTASH